ncbi:MAG: class I SAM-dependent methyltransferase [Planctomycetes bacterium]|nr:class I SAM-dependent methyltransferase [Planctomycetota bacterium]
MSLRRLLRKLRLLVRRRPRAARDVVRDYAEYLRAQREEFLSHEEDVERWAEGQRRFVREAFGGAPRSWRVLDLGCGDGVGLEELRALGFRGPVGVELAPEKAARARVRGFEVEERDMHDLSCFADRSFDAVLCSHALEHAYEPGRILGEVRRVLAPGGALCLVLPFPDPGARNERAHAAKYELGTDRDDGGEAASAYLAARGFEVTGRRRDSFREPELWLFARKAVAWRPGCRE